MRNRTIETRILMALTQSGRGLVSGRFFLESLRVPTDRRRGSVVSTHMAYRRSGRIEANVDAT